jgi:hypothetical protein
LDPGVDGFALGHVNGAEDAHFQIGCGVSHGVLFCCDPLSDVVPGSRNGFPFWRATLLAGDAGQEWDCRVVVH